MGYRWPPLSVAWAQEAGDDVSRDGLGASGIGGTAPGSVAIKAEAVGGRRRALIEFVEGILLLEVRVQEEHKGEARSRPRQWPVILGAEGKLLVGAVVVVQGQADLVEIVLAFEAVGGLADFLDGREQNADQDRDEGDDD